MTSPPLAQYWSEAKQEGRRYKHPFNGLYYPSVTTITGMEDKSGGLIQWSVDQVAKWAVNNWQTLGSKSDQRGFNQMRYRHTDVLNDRAQIGTDAHAWIEAQLKDEWVMPEVSGEALECVNQWLDLREHHDIDAKFVEVTAVNHTDHWMGTLDFGGLVDGVRTLGDAKTSRNIQHSHRMQIAALSRAESYLLEVPEGTKGASDKITVKGDDGKPRDTWWIEVEASTYDAFAFFKLRPTEIDPFMDREIPAYWLLDYVNPDEIPSLYKQFRGYLSAWEGLQEEKDIIKQKEKLAKAGSTW